MLGIVIFLAKSHSDYLRISKIPKSPLITKRPESHYLQDLLLGGFEAHQQLALLQQSQQILKKYVASQDFADFTQEDCTVLLRAFDQLGTICSNINREIDALKYYEEAMAFAIKKGINDSREIGFVHNGLGSALLSQRRLDEALVNFEKGQEILKKVGLDDESYYPYIQGFFFKGQAYLLQENFDKAEECFKVALEESEKLRLKVPIDPFQTDIYFNLANVYFKRNLIGKAHGYAFKALGRIKEFFGEYDVRNNILFRELADSFYDQRKFDDALNYAKKQNHLLTHLREANESDIIENLVLLAKTYMHKRDYSSASAYFKKVFDLLEKSPTASQVLGDVENLYILATKSCFVEGKVQEATELFNKGIDIFGKKFGKNSSEVADELTSWGRLLEKNKSTKNDAYKVYQKSLEILKKLGGQFIINIIENTTRLADLAHQLGKSEESMEYARDALKLMNESGQHLDLRDDLHRILGSQLLKEGRETEGLKHLEEAVRLCEESGDKSDKLQNYYYYLAKAYFEKRDPQKAEEVAKKALNLCALKFGKGDPNTQASLVLLSAILEVQQKTGEIAQLRQTFGTK